MATGGEEKVGYSLVRDRKVTLENFNGSAFCISIVICQDKIIIIDNEWKVRLHRLCDGKFLASTDKLYQRPHDMCLMDTNEICFIYETGLIKVMSIDVDATDMSNVFQITRSYGINHGMDKYHGIVRFKENLVVGGVKQGTMYWCVMSLRNQHVDTIHEICEGYLPSEENEWSLSYVTTKENMIYFSCFANSNTDNSGVYGFDILNPSQAKYTYKNEHLPRPRGIVINEDGNIFVNNQGTSFYHRDSIHQLTASCQLISILSDRIPGPLNDMFWDKGHLYVTCLWSSDITVFCSVHQGNHEDSEVGTSIEIEQGNVDEGQSSVEAEMPPGPPPDGSEDEKQGNHKASEFLISDEGNQPVIEGTSTQIGPEIPIQQSVEEHFERAGIEMSTEEQDCFLKFQEEIGTTVYFSKDAQTLIDVQKSLQATEMFIEQSRPDMKDEWLEYKNQGKLTPKLIEVIYAKERNPELHDKKDEILGQMENLNIIVKARSFDENGLKEENYFFTPCMLRLESPREVVAPEQDPRMLSTSVLCWVFTGTVLPPSIFDGLLAACLARWPVTKKRNTSKHLISYGCTVFDLDLTHRLTLNCKNNVVYARITWLVIDDIKTPNAKLCTRVRKFITRKLSKITDSLNQNSLNQNLQYELCLQSQESISEDVRIHFLPFQMWIEDEGHDPDSPIKPEHMNHARLCIALVTVCGKALREMLLDHFPMPYTDIYQAILAKRANLTGGQGRTLLNQDQDKLVFPDPLMQKTGTVEMFDLSLLYTLIRNVSTVQAPVTRWGIDPQPADNSLGASVERIRSYRNHISGHSPDAEINHQDFEDYWKKIEKVLRDIEVVINKNVYSTELERQKRQVISVFDAC